MLKLDEVWWLITPQNPLKISKPATYRERLNNCKYITRNYPIIVKEIEKKISSNYSYKTINYILNHYKNIKFFWLMGADNLISFHKWEKWEQITKICKILVFDRNKYKSKSLKSKSYKKLGGKGLKFINFKKVNISSSKLREI